QVSRERFPKAQLQTYKGDVNALQDLHAGRLDGIVTDRLVGLHMNERYGAGLELEGPPLYREEIAIPVHPDNPALLQELDAALGKLRASDRYQVIYDRYFGGDGAVRPGEESFSWP